MIQALTALLTALAAALCLLSPFAVLDPRGAYRGARAVLHRRFADWPAMALLWPVMLTTIVLIFAFR